MRQESQLGNKKERRNGFTFFCEKCKSIVKIFVECWTDKSDGPYKIELVQHNNTIAIKVDEIPIHDKPKGKTSRFHYCGVCGQSLGLPYDSDYLNIMDEFNPNSQKD